MALTLNAVLGLWPGYTRQSTLPSIDGLIRAALPRLVAADIWKFGQTGSDPLFRLKWLSSENNHYFSQHAVQLIKTLTVGLSNKAAVKPFTIQVMHATSTVMVMVNGESQDAVALSQTRQPRHSVRHVCH